MILSDEWYTTEEVADLLKVDKSTVMRWVNRKWLPSVDLNRGKLKKRIIRIHRDDVRRYANGEATRRRENPMSRRAKTEKPRKHFV